MAEYCRKCGKKLAENDVFCSKCGQKVEEDKIEDIEVKEEVIERSLENTDIKNSEDTSMEKTDDNTPVQDNIDDLNREKGKEKNKVVQKLKYFHKAIERKEQEIIEIISKSTLQKEQLTNLNKYPIEKIKLKYYGDFDKIYKKIYIQSSIFIATLFILIALCTLMKYLNFNQTAKVVVLLVLYLGLFTCTALVIERSYRVICIRYLKIKGKGIRKISYGKPPIMLKDGKLYVVECGECLECGGKSHIEELEESEVVVCDMDRMHLSLVDVEELEKLIESEKDKINQEDNSK